METQTALAVPDEDNYIVIYSLIQCSEFAYSTIARCLDIPKHNVGVITRRLEEALVKGGLKAILMSIQCYRGVCDSNTMEFMAIGKAMSMFPNSTRKDRVELIVESDSKNAISWITKEGSCPWKLESQYREMERDLQKLKGVEVMHTGREANNMADQLAKMGV
ncbi:putative Aldehyde oxidase [Quillaja saponaria]|uniref:Aldehyde oxidase n=1 Tax=Quillaja saponaria TaxID=32244 RepID=A0AAD7P5D9_QUISA|nr:putative Aldehyde oxidase [Quillaja saponaria]